MGLHSTGHPEAYASPVVEHELPREVSRGQCLQFALAQLRREAERHHHRVGIPSCEGAWLGCAVGGRDGAVRWVAATRCWCQRCQRCRCEAGPRLRCHGAPDLMVVAGMVGTGEDSHCRRRAGDGKTTIAMRVAAIVSAGSTFPDGTVAPAGKVLIWTGEDADDDTLVPRLIASGANLDNVHFVSEVEHNGQVVAFDPSLHMGRLAEAARMVGDISLLVVHSIADVVSGDSHENSETRRGLRPLGDFAEKLNCAVLGIAHFNKGSAGKDPLERVMGSAAFGAVARVVFACAKIVENDVVVRRVFCRAKSNIGPDDGGFEYRLENTTIVGESMPAVPCSVQLSKAPPRKSSPVQTTRAAAAPARGRLPMPNTPCARFSRTVPSPRTASRRRARSNTTYRGRRCAAPRKTSWCLPARSQNRGGSGRCPSGGRQKKGMFDNAGKGADAQLSVV